MVNITPEQLDAACAAYARSTGSYPNRAGLRSALHTIDFVDIVQRMADEVSKTPSMHVTVNDLREIARKL
jgi:hypothetical protein